MRELSNLEKVNSVNGKPRITTSKSNNKMNNFWKRLGDSLWSLYEPTHTHTYIHIEYAYGERRKNSPKTFNYFIFRSGTIRKFIPWIKFNFFLRLHSTNQVGKYQSLVRIYNCTEKKKNMRGTKLECKNRSE